MKMGKNLKRALTVAAIAGTCALSSPSFAAWTPDAPTKLGANLVSTQATADDGMVAVGQDGKAYIMFEDDMDGTPSWKSSYPPATTDFVQVVNDQPASGAGAGDFYAVTSNGTLVKNDGVKAANTVWRNVKLSAANRALIAGKTIVGLAAPAAGQLVMLASDGTMIYSNDAGSTWTDISTALKAHAIATNGIKGIAYYDGTDVLVYGATNEAKTDANLLKIDVDAADPASNITASIAIDGCPTINAVSSGATYVYVAGNSGKIARCAVALSGTDTVLDVPGSPTTNFKAITYNEAETYGYVAGADGSLYRIENTTVTKRDISAYTEKDLNALTSFAKSDGTRRTFAAGNDGVSIYNDESYWSATAGTDAPTGPLAITAGDGDVFIFEAAQLLTSSAPGSTWKKGAEGGSAEAPTGTSVVYYKKDASNRFIFAAGDAGNTGKVSSYKYDGTTVTGLDVDAKTPGPDYVTKVGTSTIVMVESTAAKVPSTINMSTADFSGAVTATDGALVLDGTVECQGIAGTTNGFYALIGADATCPLTELKALGGKAGNALSLDFTADGTANDYSTPIGLTNNAALGGVTDIDISSTTDGELIIICQAGALKIVVAKDIAATDIETAGAFTVTDLGYPTGLTNAPVKAWGTKTDMYMTDGTDVYRYNNSVWTKYDSVTSAVAAMTATGVSGVAAYDTGKVVAIDPDAAAYSAGASFTAAFGDQFNVSSTINSAFNATKSDVYVAGADGLLYNATQKAGSSSFTWGDRYKDSFFGSKNIAKVAGAGSSLFVTYGTGNKEMAFKTLAETSWTEATVATAGGITLGTVNDIAPASATVVYAADGTNGLIKGSVSGSTITFTKQTKTASSDTTPASLDALSLLGTDTIYAVGGSSGSPATKLYKYSDPSGDVWTIKDITLPSVPSNGLADVVAIAADKIYAVGADGYAISYDGSKVTKLTAPTSYNLTSCWAYDGVLYAGDNNGQVHEYNIESKTWTSGTVQAGVTIKDVTGSSKGEFILAVGTSGTAERSSISSSGGGQTTTKTQPGTGEDADLVASATVETKTSSELTSSYKTPAMTVLGQVQSFTTKSGLTAGSVHNFKFNVTPSSDTRVGSVSLFKLLSASGGSNIKYVRKDAAPSSATDGAFWITDANGNVMATADTLKANTVYTVNLGIKDGGSYDTDGSADGVITDPTVLGTTSSSDSSSGCVFNPTQTFGLEWLLLMFAPLVGIIRSRFKK